MFFSGVEYTLLNSAGEPQSYVNPIKYMDFTDTYWDCILCLAGIGFGLHVIAVIFLKILIRRLNA